MKLTFPSGFWQVRVLEMVRIGSLGGAGVAIIIAAGAVAGVRLFFADGAGIPQVYRVLPEKMNADLKRNIFISGHSLTARPVPDYLGEIAAGAGVPIWWNTQDMGGSSIRQRSYGQDGEPSWSGFSQGTDRNGNPIDVRKELASPSSPTEKPYDVLVITEQHRLLDSLIWQDTTRYLYAFHSEFIAANPNGTTYFYAPWIDLSDKSDPLDWIEYERQASPIWQCVVAHVNDQIAAEKRQDRIYFIPVSLALAELINHLYVEPDAAGFEGRGARARIDAIFSDRVHLTPLGAYFAAAVSFSAIFGREAGDVSPASGLNEKQAETVRTFAAAFVGKFREQSAFFGGWACRSPVSLAFASRYAAYVQRTYGDETAGVFRSKTQQLRNTLRFAWRLRNGFGLPQP